MKQFRFGELFCGAGGFALGIKNAKHKLSTLGYSLNLEWAIDVDKDSCTTYQYNICPNEPERVICADVHKIDWSMVPPINALVFGFPCNDFSLVGKKAGLHGQFGPLYRYGVLLLNQFEPDWFIAENVKGLASANNGHAFLQIIDELENAGSGYELTTHLYNFAEYGVPQTRQRIIIVGIKKSLNLRFEVPAPEGGYYRTVRQVLEENPIPLTTANHEFNRVSPRVVQRLQYINPGENAWNADIPSSLQLHVKGARMSQIYRRLEPDKPAYTITASGGGGTHVYHWSENRPLTNRERARLQTFPDDFIFFGSKTSVRRQIGMAVPPLAAQILVEAIGKTLARVPYPSISAKWDTIQRQLPLKA